MRITKGKKMRFGLKIEVETYHVSGMFLFHTGACVCWLG